LENSSNDEEFVAHEARDASPGLRALRPAPPSATSRGAVTQEPGRKWRGNVRRSSESDEKRRRNRAPRNFSLELGKFAECPSVPEARCMGRWRPTARTAVAASKNAGAASRSVDGRTPNTAALRERLEFEIKTIVQMGLHGILPDRRADFINWGRVTACRSRPRTGAGAGSLVGSR